MNPLQETAEARYQQMEKALLDIKSTAQTFQEEAQRSIPVVRLYLQELRQEALKEALTKETEIYLFKQVKPKFYCLLIYYYKALQIELGKPAASRKVLNKYLSSQQNKLIYFYKKYSFFHLYCRSGFTSLDNQFFMRGNLDLLPGIATYGIDTDPSFTTGYDFLLAKIKANELLQQYLDREQEKLTVPGYAQSTPAGSKVTWTGSKASLIELLYALQSTGVLNYGSSTLNEIALFIERVFGVKLGNYYRVFQEIRIRKKSRTQFLDEMKERLIQKMDYTDENPHIK